jgi:hypothetical protein
VEIADSRPFHPDDYVVYLDRELLTTAQFTTPSIAATTGRQCFAILAMIKPCSAKLAV